MNKCFEQLFKIYYTLVIFYVKNSIHQLFAQIEHVPVINQLTSITTKVVEAA
ncbi:hypothetical protein MKZ02_22155 [Pseudobacillus sp. FSL P4-0506]|uniref:hypothetical protein n=1 Tax=Pseudobacillus sp. FSL P4-0506 TaxID=2921576 RepID=UPI0030F96CEF